MKKLLVLLYGVTNYALGSAALVYLIAFIFNLFVPVSIDSGEAGNIGQAAVINVGLILLFALQHSIMARPAFKKRLTKIIPQAAERSTFMVASAFVTFALCLLWQPMPEVIWQAEYGVLYNVLLGVGLAGWAIVFYATFLINHFDLFGLRQVWLYFIGKEYKPLSFKLSSLYKVIRHPIMTGVLIGTWVTPVMTVGHLVLAIGFTTYIIIGVYHEEKDLINEFGEKYLGYMRTTGKFFPAFAKRNQVETPVSAKA